MIAAEFHEPADAKVHLQGEAPVRDAAVELFGQAAEVHFLAAQAIDRAHHLHERAAEAVELPHHQHVVRTQEGEGGLELRLDGACHVGLLLLKSFLAPGLQQRVALEVEVLILGGHARVADKHVSIAA